MGETGVVRDIRLPSKVDEVTAEWLTAMLSRFHPGIEVISLEIRNIIHGFATKIFLKAEFNEVGAAEDIPSDLCLKAGFEPNNFDFGEQLYYSETIAYGDWLHVAPVRTPRCYFAAVDEESGQSLILIDDLVARGASINYATRPITVDQAADAMHSLARLHAKWWGTKGPQNLTAVRPPRIYMFEDMEYVTDYLENHGRADVLPVELHDPQRILRALLIMAPQWNKGPLCLNHGDAHPGNTYIDRDGVFGFFDWQIPDMRTWAREVSYFLGSNLTIVDRRSSERDLLVEYLERLSANGVDAPSFATAWLDYRRWMIRPLTVWISNRDGDYQPAEVNVTNTERAGAAFMDLDCFEAIDGLA